MILLFGTRTSAALRAMVELVCAFCGFSAPQRVLERRSRLTLFWIPLLTVSHSFVNVCSACGREVELTEEQVERAEAWAQWQAAH
ncbi:MAG: zinc-ribbon domain-containing protein [Amnibacterium sp.]